MKLVFFLEEKSMQKFLNEVLPKILPRDIDFLTIPHEGKSDLEKSLSHKLRVWNEPDVKFIVIQDQDSWDCKKLKIHLAEICQVSGKNVLIRIACHELESWYFGDLRAVSQAYGKDLTRYISSSKYRVPDDIINPKQELLKLIPEHQQISGAERIGKYVIPENNKSYSFKMLLSGIKKILNNM